MPLAWYLDLNSWDKLKSLKNCRYTYFVLKVMFSTNESNHVLILHMHDTDINE